MRPLSLGARYAISLVATSVALALSRWLSPLLDDYTLSLPVAAVLVSGLLGGWGPGATCAVLSSVGFHFLVMTPPLSFSLADPRDLVHLVIFFGTSAGVVWLSASFRAQALAHVDLAHQARHLAAIVESSSDAIIGKTLEGIVVSWNDAAEQIYGYRRDEIVGRPITLLADAQAAAEARAILARVAAGERVTGWHNLSRRKDGSHIDVELSLSPVRDERGRIAAASVIARDLSEKRRTEQALVTSRARFSRLSESGIIGIGIGDLDGNLSEANDALLKMLGATREELRAGRLSWRGVTPAEASGTCELATEQLRAVGVVQPWEQPLVRPDGQRLQVLVTAARVDGQCMLLALDRTARRSAEQERDRLITELRRALHVRDQFLSTASHELRTPVAAAKLTVQSLLDLDTHGASGFALSPQVRGRLEALERQHRRLTRLIEQLLDVSRIMSGRLVLERETVSLSAVVREVLEEYAYVATKARCELLITDDPSIVGEWDPVRLEQIVGNLVSNAIKFGGGKPIELVIGGDAEVGRLRVRDHGIGIAVGDQQRIFDRFERLVSSRHFGGLGLGLWITRQNVEAHGGTLRVESEPGHGATFVVELPRQPPPAPPPRDEV